MSFADVLGICVLLALMLSTGFLSYVVLIIVPFLGHRAQPKGDRQAFAWHFVIPCRDEEAVMGSTLDYLCAHFPDAHLWVVDDASLDGTAAIVRERAAHSPHVHLLQRRLPEARTGKSDALNHAYREISAWLPTDADRSRVIIAVVDADGCPSANLLDVCSGATMYGDDQVGAVQVEVRMSNRHDRTPMAGGGRMGQFFARQFIRMQDIEFRGPISAIQMSRRHSRTVNVGGNGQLTRLSALDSIAGDKGPWKGSLLEDFELGLHLLLHGWRNVYTRDAWVDQEALFHVRRFLVQRTRWCQGTMQCLRYLPRVWASRRVTNLGAVEISYFLFQPWLQVLGSIVYPVPVCVMLYNAVYYPRFTVNYLAAGGWSLIALYLVIGGGEFGVWALLYRYRCEPTASRGQALGWSLAFPLYQYFVVVIAYRSLFRMILGRSDWAKTRRNAETATAHVQSRAGAEPAPSADGPDESTGLMHNPARTV